MTLRFKAFHIYNAGPIFEAMMTIAKPFMPTKMTDRVCANMFKYALCGSDLCCYCFYIKKIVQAKIVQANIFILLKP